MWYLYILLCDESTYYVGITRNIQNRIREHEQHNTFYTKRFKEFKLVHSEPFSNKILAAKREKQIKGWSRAKKSALVEGNLVRLERLSKSLSGSP